MGQSILINAQHVGGLQWLASYKVCGGALQKLGEYVLTTTTMQEACRVLESKFGPL